MFSIISNCILGLGSDGWVTAFHSLTGTAQQPAVILRVAFGSDVIIHGEGFAFDDIIIMSANLYEGNKYEHNSFESFTTIEIMTNSLEI